MGIKTITEVVCDVCGRDVRVQPGGIMTYPHFYRIKQWKNDEDSQLSSQLSNNDDAYWTIDKTNCIVPLDSDNLLVDAVACSVGCASAFINKALIEDSAEGRHDPA